MLCFQLGLVGKNTANHSKPQMSISFQNHELVQGLVCTIFLDALLQLCLLLSSQAQVAAQMDSLHSNTVNYIHESS